MRSHWLIAAALVPCALACGGGAQPVDGGQPADGGVAAADADKDGVTDTDDACPATPAGAAVDAQGCAPSQLPPLPPDPSTLAPPLDPNSATDVYSGTAFLYSGSTPTQTGVAPGTIQRERASALNGRVISHDGAALSAVTVSVLGHPELGQTLSRADGRYDLVVNGGTLLTLRYTRAGFLPVQRQVFAPIADYAVMPDVALLLKDKQVTKISLGAAAPLQVARGSVQTDASGTRQATILFPAGTTASLVQPDGSLLPAPTLSVRLTEYTVGPNGLAAMPGELPASSGYTWASELGVDEAVAKVDGRDVVFSQPVYLYLENFAGLPAGEVVPVGYYDPAKSTWRGARNGVVLKVVGVTGGMADLDVTGDGAADTGAALTVLGITDAERQKLAGLYTPGQSLWRTPLEHFSTIDCNWSVICLALGCSPPKEKAPVPQTSCQSTVGGSIIGCERQTLGEGVPLTGSPLTLHYQSDRVPGRTAEQALAVSLATGGAPNGVQSTQVEVVVAGQKLALHDLAPTTTSTTLAWDGKDVWGRPVQGSQRYTVRVGYTWKVVYARASMVAISWARLSGVPLTGSPARMEVTLWQERHGLISRWDNRGLGLGGWGLDALHAYDTVGRVLQLGDGTRIDSESLGAGAISTIAGSTGGFFGDNGPATAAKLSGPSAVVAAADGTVYVADSGNHRVRRISPAGIITTVAGTGAAGDDGDGGPATQARFKDVTDIALGPNGSLYIADRLAGKVRRVGSDGVISAVAGNGSVVFSGDGRPATATGLEPYGLAVASDGTLYIADRANSRIRVVDLEGIITTFAGSANYGFQGDDGPATDARLSGPRALALGPDGSLFILDFTNARVRRVSPQGLITTVAGNGTYGAGGDGGPAVSAQLAAPGRLAVGRDGSLYIADFGSNRIRMVGPDGLISTVAGTGASGLSGDNGLALQAKLSGPTAVAVAPDGALYLADFYNHRLRKVRAGLPGASASDLLIPASDGSEVYVFTGSGRHLRTLHGLTGAVLLSFAYDSAGRLASVTDGDGNVTSLERDAAGNPSGLVAPFGQRTSFSVDAAGYLSKISNPANESVLLTSTAGGLLTQFTDARGNSSSFTYDSLGRLLRDVDAAGGFSALTRTEAAQSVVVARATALGRVESFEVGVPAGGGQRRLRTYADGTSMELLKGPDNGTRGTWSDGTVTASVPGVDPRWGTLAPFVASSSLTTGGLSSQVTSTAAATLSDANNPFSLTQLNQSLVVNGHTFTSVYAAASRTTTSTSPVGRKYTTVTDAQGRVVQAQLAGLQSNSASYDARGRLASVTQGTGVDVRTVTFSYGDAGFVDAVTDALGRTRSFGYDAAGRVTGVTLADGQAVLFAYDASGNIISVAPAGRPGRSYEYTAVGLSQEYLPPDAGAGSTATEYAWDVDRQLTRVTRPDGTHLDLAYDGAGRAITMTLPSGVARYTYDATSGKLTSIAAAGGGGTLGFSYNGALLTRTDWTGAVTGNVSATYDAELRLGSLSVNGASPVAFQYDADGMLTHAGALTLSRNAQNGLVTGTTLSTVADAFVFDGLGEVSLYTATRSGVELFKTLYAYDKLGRITTRTETVSGVTDVFGYGYDLSGRLVQVKKNGVVRATYTFDGNGNRLTGPGLSVAATYDAQDRLVQYGATAFTYWVNGQVRSQTTAGAVTNYDYDSLGNLTQVLLPSGNLIDYLIDGQGRRIGKKVNGAMVQSFLYETQLRPIVELDSANQVVSRFVYGTHTNVPDYMVKAGSTYRLLTDHLGSVRLVVDVATGAVAQRLDYDEFGQVLSDSSPAFQPFGFAGGLYDSGSGLVHFGARDYAPAFGRWLSPEPLLQRNPRFALAMARSGMSSPAYAYAANNPIRFIDRDGLRVVVPSTASPRLLAAISTLRGNSRGQFL